MPVVKSSPERQSSREMNKLPSIVSEHATPTTDADAEGKESDEVSKSVDAVPKFSVDELEYGRLLGKGQFGWVFEIKAVKLTEEGGKEAAQREVRDDEDTLKTQRECFRRRTSVASLNAYDAYQVESRHFIAKHCIREEGGHARYACKVLKREVLENENRFTQAAKDLAVEAFFLSTVEHPNIVKLRGMATGGMCNKGFFIVMDRLYDTLEQRIDKWKKRREKLNSFKSRIMDWKGKKKESLLDDQLRAAFDLAAALEYLHSNDIMHRDLKPENIGFDVRDDVKMFDFGLATELRPEKRVQNGLYKLTGNTGSMRFMAPEVFRREPYNSKADVYSYSLVLWQMFHLVYPFAPFKREQMRTEVFEKGVRPEISEEYCSEQVRLLLELSWKEDVEKRMSSGTMKEGLKRELIRVRKEEDEHCLDQAHSRRRSTHVAPQMSEFGASRKVLEALAESTE